MEKTIFKERCQGASQVLVPRGSDGFHSRRFTDFRIMSVSPRHADLLGEVAFSETTRTAVEWNEGETRGEL